MTKRLTVISLSALMILVVSGLVVIWLRSTTVFLVIRHAERSDTITCTPATVKTRQNWALILGADGKSARAETLVHLAGSDSVSAIYASEFCRTRDTVQPLATHLGLAVTVVDQYEADGVTINVDNLINQVWANNRGQVVFIAGHSDTVPVIIERLSGVTIDSIGTNEFDNLYVVIVPRWWGMTKVVRLKYGAKSMASLPNSFATENDFTAYISRTSLGWMG